MPRKPTGSFEVGLRLASVTSVVIVLAVAKDR